MHPPIGQPSSYVYTSPSNKKKILFVQLYSILENWSRLKPIWKLSEWRKRFSKIILQVSETGNIIIHESDFGWSNKNNRMVWDYIIHVYVSSWSNYLKYLYTVACMYCGNKYFNVSLGVLTTLWQSDRWFRGGSLGVWKARQELSWAEGGWLAWHPSPGDFAPPPLPPPPLIPPLWHGGKLFFNSNLYYWGK